MESIGTVNILKAREYGNIAATPPPLPFSRSLRRILKYELSITNESELIGLSQVSTMKAINKGCDFRKRFKQSSLLTIDLALNKKSCKLTN